jgi:hypothetical protein
MNAEFARLIAARRHYTPFPPTHQNGLALQRRIVKAFDRNKKAVEIEMGDIALWLQHHLYNFPFKYFVKYTMPCEDPGHDHMRTPICIEIAHQIKQQPPQQLDFKKFGNVASK